MGVGKPTDILKCYKMGYNMFDCVIPTRDARHARMYLIDNSGNLSTLNLSNKVFENDKSPIDSNCNCYSCKNFSKAYLRYLYKTGEVRFNGLASIHNLATYSKLIEGLN